MGAPGVATSPAICAPLACARDNAVMSVMPLPLTSDLPAAEKR